MAQKQSTKNPQAGFAYSQDQFQQLIEDSLSIAQKMGATDAAAEVSEGMGLSVSVRKGKLENVERNRDKTIGITVFVGQRRGNASTLRTFRHKRWNKPSAPLTTSPATPQRTLRPACLTQKTWLWAKPPSVIWTCFTLGR